MPPSKSRKIAILGYRSVGECRPAVAGVLGGLCPRFTRRRRGRGRARPSRSSQALAGAEQRAQEAAGPLPRRRPARMTGLSWRSRRRATLADREARARARFAFPAWAEPVQRAFLGGRRGWDRAEMPLRLPREALPGLSGAPRSPSEQRSWDGGVGESGRRRRLFSPSGGGEGPARSPRLSPTHRIQLLFTAAIKLSAELGGSHRLFPWGLYQRRGKG